MENDFFDHSDNEDIPEQDYMDAIQRLIDKGLVREVWVDGEVKYQLTYEGRAVASHLESDSSTRN